MHPNACDRLRYEAIAKPELTADGGAFAIRIKPDGAANTLTVTDNGIGMDRQELIDNLGTVARSGTRAFMSKLADAKDCAGLIGQFGVGFYSAFMVAERIEVLSRRAGSPRPGLGPLRGALASKSLRQARHRRHVFRAAPKSCCT
jgi:molecular chaperone HtpG